MNLFKQISLLAFPVVLANMLQTAITLIDTLMIGQLGPVAIAAVGMGNAVRIIILIFVLAVAAGTMSLMAQARGARDPKRMSEVTRQGILSGILLSIIVGAIGYVTAEPLLGFMNHKGDPEAVDLGTEFLELLFLGTPFLVLNTIVNRLMQAAGDTFTPLILTFVMVLLNILFNYLFIFGWMFIPAYGVMGAAIGTLIARGVLVIAAIFIFYSGKNVVKILEGSWLPHWPMIKDMLSIGLPSGLQGFLRNAANVLFMRLISMTSLGTYGAAALAIGIQAESLIVYLGVGVNVAATALVGQEIGKWQIPAARQKGNLSILLGVVAMTLLMLPMVYFAPEIIPLFDPSVHPMVLEGSLTYFRINILLLPIYGVGLILMGVFRGAGDTQPALISTLLGRNLLALSLAWFLAFYLEWDYLGIWIGLISGRMFESIFLWIVWRREKWIQVALKLTEVYRKHLHKLPEAVSRQFLNEVRAIQMKKGGTMEVVDADGVRYVRLGEEVRFVFEDRGYLEKK